MIDQTALDVALAVAESKDFEDFRARLLSLTVRRAESLHLQAILEQQGSSIDYSDAISSLEKILSTLHSKQNALESRLPPQPQEANHE